MDEAGSWDSLQERLRLIVSTTKKPIRKTTRAPIGRKSSSRVCAARTSRNPIPNDRYVSGFPTAQ